VKFLKLLIVPAAVLLSVATAVPVFANHAEISAQLKCTQVGQVCFDLTVSTEDFPPEGREFKLTLLGHKKGDNADSFSQIGSSQTLKLENNLDNKVVNVCFETGSVTQFDEFKLKIEAVGSDLTVNGETAVTLGPFDNTCPTPTPTATATPTPTPTATASPVAALANTGGLDLRFPLIGLTVLVAGLALLLVSFSRGRSTPTK
jgi:hypothetical protein